jgi:hypothetical protein
LLANTDGLTILYTDGGVVRDNILIQPLHYERFTDDYASTTRMYGQRGYFSRPRRAPISIWSSRDIEVTANRIYWSGPAGEQEPVDVGEFNTNIRVEANRFIDLGQADGMFLFKPNATQGK